VRVQPTPQADRSALSACFDRVMRNAIPAAAAVLQRCRVGPVISAGLLAVTGDQDFFAAFDQIEQLAKLVLRFKGAHLARAVLRQAGLVQPNPITNGISTCALRAGPTAARPG
jgi:hypothetical protein